MNLTRADGTPINKWEDWTPPKHEKHWKSGRSAMELARAWFRVGQNAAPPEELIELLSSHERLTNLEFIQGTPELVTQLPQKGEGRNHDLHFICKTPLERVTFCIEAKADEPFGNYQVDILTSIVDTSKIEKSLSRARDVRPGKAPGQTTFSRPLDAVGIAPTSLRSVPLYKIESIGSSGAGRSFANIASRGVHPG